MVSAEVSLILTHFLNVMNIHPSELLTGHELRGEAVERQRRRRDTFANWSRQFHFISLYPRIISLSDKYSGAN